MFLKMIVFNLCKNVVEIMLNLLTVFFLFESRRELFGKRRETWERKGQIDRIIFYVHLKMQHE